MNTIKLGGNTSSFDSKMQVELGKWNTFEISNDGPEYVGMNLNGTWSRENMTIQANMNSYFRLDQISLGGYAEGQLNTTEVQDLNFEGCIEEFYFGPDPINLSVDSPGAYGVQPGCTEGEINLVTFPAANPGYMQLQSFDIQDQIEISFMFRTSQSRALLLYMHDTPGMEFSFNFFYHHD